MNIGSGRWVRRSDVCGQGSWKASLCILACIVATVKSSAMVTTAEERTKTETRAEFVQDTTARPPPRRHRTPAWACLHDQTTAGSLRVSTESCSASFAHHAGPKT